MAYIFAVILFPVISRPIVYAGFIKSLHRGGGANTRQETKLKTGGGQRARLHRGITETVQSKTGTAAIS